MLNDDEASLEKEKIEKSGQSYYRQRDNWNLILLSLGAEKEKKMKMNCLPEKEKERASQLLLIASWLSFVIASSID